MGFRPQAFRCLVRPDLSQDCTLNSPGTTGVLVDIPINQVMLWFCNRVARPLRFIGIHCNRDSDSYELLVLYPDGSEEAECFEDASSMVDAAKKLGKDLARLGWEPCPTASAVAPRES